MRLEMPLDMFSSGGAGAWIVFRGNTLKHKRGTQTNAVIDPQKNTAS